VHVQQPLMLSRIHDIRLHIRVYRPPSSANPARVHAMVDSIYRGGIDKKSHARERLMHAAI
jgi:hypothetical protein